MAASTLRSTPSTPSTSSPRSTARTALLAAAVMAALAVAPGAHANSEGTTQQNLPYVSGGVTAGEVDDLRGDRRNYALEVITAAKPSGAYLAAVQVELTRADGTPVLTTELDGPYLLVDLEPGRYTMVAHHEGQTQRRTIEVGKGSRRQMLLYFDDPAQLSPDLVQARERNAPQAWESSIGGPEAAALEARNEAQQGQGQQGATTGSNAENQPTTGTNSSAGTTGAGANATGSTSSGGTAGSSTATNSAGNGNAATDTGSAGSGATGSGTSAGSTGASPGATAGGSTGSTATPPQ